jgi:excisionase family DNA binding protein
MTTTPAIPLAGMASLTRDEAARFLGVAPLTLSRWVASRKIGAYRVARRLRFSEHHLRAFLKRQEVRER